MNTLPIFTCVLTWPLQFYHSHPKFSWLRYETKIRLRYELTTAKHNAFTLVASGHMPRCACPCEQTATLLFPLLLPAKQCMWGQCWPCMVVVELAMQLHYYGKVPRFVAWAALNQWPRDVWWFVQALCNRCFWGDIMHSMQGCRHTSNI